MLAVEKLKERFPEEVLKVEESAGQVAVLVKREAIVPVLRFLHDDFELFFHHLADLTAVDWLGKKSPRFEIVYNLYSIRYKQYLRVKAPVPEEDPHIPTVTTIWKTANWFEREVYDMFGIIFDGHPDLRRLIMPDDWQGYPLRKDYPLFLEEGEEWPGYKALRQKARELGAYDWYRRVPMGEEALKKVTEEEGHGSNA